MVSGRPSCISTSPENGKYRARIIQRLPRRIQKLEKGTDALRPGGFIMLRAFDALVVQVLSELPAFFEKHVTKFLYVLHDALALACADVQPDAWSRLNCSRLSETVNDKLVPPYGGRQGGYLSKHARMFEPEIERDQSAQRGAADAIVLGPRKCAVFSLDERLHFLQQEFGIAIGAAAAEFGHMSWSVFADPCFRVVHADDDERLYFARLDASIRSLTDVPILPGDE